MRILASTFAFLAATTALAADSTYQSTATASSAPIPFSAKKTLLTLQFIGGSNDLSIDASAPVGNETLSMSGGQSGTSVINGISAGLTQKMSDQFAIEGEIASVTKKFDTASINGTSMNEAGKGSTKFPTLRFTGMARAYVAPQVSVGAGAYASSIIGDMKVTSETGETMTVPLWFAGRNRVDYGAVVGAKGIIPISAEMAISLDLRYFYGLANQFDESLINGMNNSNFQMKIAGYTRDLQAGAGLAFAF